MTDLKQLIDTEHDEIGDAGVKTCSGRFSPPASLLTDRALTSQDCCN